jgi:cell division protein FtsL
MNPSVLGRAATIVAFFVGSTGFVLWRQSRAFEANRALDDVRREVSIAQAERVDLGRQIQVLESRTRIVPEARTRLGMHTPDAAEQVILAVGDSQ